MKTAAKICFVDDDEAVRRSLCRLFESAGYQTVAFQSAEAALAGADISEIDCLILDLQMPGIDGLQLQGIVNQSDERVSIIFLTGHGDVPTSVRALKSGAVDFLEKPVDGELLQKAVDEAVERTRRIRLQSGARKAALELYRQLTARESDVFWLVADGLSSREIAIRLGISERTAKAHRASASRKLKTNSLSEFVLFSHSVDKPA